jgi:Carbohydrate binding domain.
MATLLERAEQIRDEVQEAANTAQRVGQLLIDLITEMKGADSRYLSGIRPDTAHAPIHFAQGLTAKEVRTEGTEQVQEQLLVGDFLSGQSGARINKDGAAEVETLTVRSRLEVAEMQINRLTAVEGDWLLTESGTVEQVEQRGTQWVLTMRRRFEGDITAFAVHDVIKGIVSTAAVRAFRPNTPLPTPETVLYAVAWLRVESVDINDNSITCSLYDNADVPGGANMQPCEGMNLARWGNTSIAERRSCLYLSSREGRIMHLQGVTAPKITAEHQRASFGTLPDFLKSELGEVVDGKDDYLFARGLVVQDIIRLDAKANPIPEIVDRGNWQQGTTYYGGTRNPETKRFEISDVWLDGARWRCTTTKSEGTTETPAPNSIHWTLIQAKPKDGSPGYDGKSAPPTNPNLLNFTAKWRDKEGNIPYQTGESRKGGANITTPDGGKYGTKCFRVQADPEAAPGNNGIYAFNVGNERITGTLKAGQWYTYSFYVRGKGYLRSSFYFQMNPVVERRTSVNGLSRDNANYLYQPISDEWRRVVCTFRVESGRVFPWFFSSLSESQSTDDWLEICCAKLEEGEDATPWCLSEEDKKGTDGRDGESYHTNLLDNSAFAKGLERWNYETAAAEIDDTTKSPIPGTHAVRYETQMLNGQAFASMTQEVGNRLRPNTTYTLSAWVKTTKGIDRASIVTAHKPLDAIYINHSHDGEWTRYALTFTTPEVLNAKQWILLRLFRPATNAAVWFAAPKLEIGDTPTEWTTSENDRKGKSSHMHTAYANSADGQVGFTTTPGGADFDYIGIYTDFEEEASPDPLRYAWAKVKGKQGAPGEKGDPGEKGKNGRGIAHIETFYLLTADGTAPGYDTRGWRSAPPVPTSQTPWLWTYERVVYSDGNSERNTVRLVTRLGTDGAEAQPTRRNLLDGTDFHQAGAWEPGINGVHAKTETVKDVQPAVTGCGVLRIIVERGAVGEEYAQFSQRIPADLIAGQDYTFSVYVRGSNTGWMIVFPNSGEHFRLSAAKPGEWKRMSVSFKARAARPGEENRAYLRCWLKNADNTQRHEVLFCAPKLEEGTTATPWCLSENDKVGATVQYRGFWDAFADGTVFRGRNQTGGGYEDVVTVLTPAGTQETYRCTRTHTKAGNDTRPGANSPYWKKGDSFEMVSTRLLLAGSAQVDKLSTGNISEDRMVTAGAEMRFYAAGCKHPGLVFGYRSDTQNRRFPVMQCFDPETGALLYDLGPEGIFANARRVAGTWTPLQMIRLTRYTTISQLYNWLNENIDNWQDPEIAEMNVESPYFADNVEEFPLYQFGHGAYYTEGWSEFRRADGSMHKIFESSRTSIPAETYPAAFWYNPLENNQFTTAAPENALVDEHGAALGDINATRVKDGWYCSRICPIRIEQSNYQINVEGRTLNVPLYAIDLWKFHAGKKVETGTTYFVEYDLDKKGEAPSDGRAHKGRNRRGFVDEDSRNIINNHIAIFDIQGFETRPNNSIKPQQN